MSNDRNNLTNLNSLRELVNHQAEDACLWFVAQTAPEAYVQQKLRELHAAIESATDEPPAGQAALPGGTFLVFECERCKDWTLFGTPACDACGHPRHPHSSLNRDGEHGR